MIVLGSGPSADDGFHAAAGSWVPVAIIAMSRSLPYVMIGLIGLVICLAIRQTNKVSTFGASSRRA
jgi:hypothetical protein